MLKPRGFSLIELTIVMALSLTMMGVISGIYIQRKIVATDDAAKQIASIIQGVSVDAKQGLGPSDPTLFNTGDTFYGEAIQFINNSGINPCMKVSKLKMSTAGVVSSYESNNVSCPQGFMFDTSSATKGYSYVVIKNGSGLMYSTSSIPTADFVDGSNGSLITNDLKYTITTGIPVSTNWPSSTTKYTLTISPDFFGVVKQ